MCMNIVTVMNSIVYNNENFWETLIQQIIYCSIVKENSLQLTYITWLYFLLWKVKCWNILYYLYIQFSNYIILCVGGSKGQSVLYFP